ncbi:DUF6492 family protein [Paenibacillus glacialis]|uniref:Nucleotide-diphospho-sugar transferase domain-containing protein n=1 Tax=Paenibacillus glacialis TaxID=494026 RepID=A0A168JL33_9BACL|nr:DUF6492 family protein [Paenibacillus glacialis]OAB40776.1 hypothetical protein PGLA_17545 [Paenibacillus glacialis]
MPIPRKSELRSRTKIDILIPAIEKDLGTLPFVIDAVRKYVKHPIGHIMIVAPKKRRIMELCRRKGCKFINENTVLPITKKNINYRSTRWERSGWMFQQLLKLNGDTLSSSNFFLVMDADTVLIRPHIFRSGNKTIFYCRNWSQGEYFRTYRKLMGRQRSSSTSFVTHYMLFEKSKLRQMKKAIEARHHTSWYSAILRSMDKTKQFAFSEFETYGNFLHSTYPSGLIRKQALNKSLHMSVTQASRARVNSLSYKFRSISFHKRKDYTRKLTVRKK